MIPLTLLFFAQKRNLLIPLELSRVMHQGNSSSLLVQKKVAEVLQDERFGASFQMGMLASFESFFRTASRARRSLENVRRLLLLSLTFVHRFELGEDRWPRYTRYDGGAACVVCSSEAARFMMGIP